MTLIGYARISTDDGRQTTLRQFNELRAAGCTEVVEEHASGAERARSVLNHLLRGLRPGLTVCVVKLDRLARSTKDLLDIVDTIERAGAHLRVLGDPIDTLMQLQERIRIRPRPAQRVQGSADDGGGGARSPPAGGPGRRRLAGRGTKDG